MSKAGLATTLATVHRLVRWFRWSAAALPTPIRPPGRTNVRQRYQLERLLHDGAVAEISALALELGMISDTTRDAEAAARVAAAQNRVTGILDDLRRVEAMIYPPVLAGAGLGPGLRAVAERLDLRLLLDLPRTALGGQARARIGLLIADHLHTLRPGSVVGVRVRGRRIVRVSITDQQPGGSARRAHRAVLRCE
ncbi:histidine kinase [Saccharopolyspora indica]|uniref:histidine kinase n=1 Tax=Saccharopolyspora indica TaxID=1229659 RepID=UPI0022EADF6A|nr:histidine kinase [Saccharopolyspora indica]MDA3650210.1 histidine kinase [Saccharopolyspora indica]